MKFKKTVGNLLVMATLATSTVAISVSAQLDEFYNSSVLENVIDSFGKAAVSNSFRLGDNKGAFVVTPENDAYCFIEYYQNTVITEKEGKTIPVDEINSKINRNLINYYDNGTYTFNAGSNPEDRKKIYEVLKTYDEVSSIDECCEVRTPSRGLWSVQGIYVNTELTPEKFAEAYGKLGLKYKESTYAGEDKKYYFEFDESFGNKLNSTDYYDELKKLTDDKVDYKFNFEIASVNEISYQTYKTDSVSIYKASNDITTITDSETVTAIGTTTPVTTTSEKTSAKTTATSAKKSPDTGDKGIATFVFTGMIAAFVLFKKK